MLTAAVPTANPSEETLPFLVEAQLEGNVLWSPAQPEDLPSHYKWFIRFQLGRRPHRRESRNKGLRERIPRVQEDEIRKGGKIIRERLGRDSVSNAAAQPLLGSPSLNAHQISPSRHREMEGAGVQVFARPPDSAPLIHKEEPYLLRPLE